MTEFTITYWGGRSGDIEMSASAGSADYALKIAEQSGSGTSITAPDGKIYEVSDFIIAMGNGAFD